MHVDVKITSFTSPYDEPFRICFEYESFTYVSRTFEVRLIYIHIMYSN